MTAAIGLCALVVGACTSDPTQRTTSTFDVETTSTSTTMALVEATAAFMRCLSENGVEVEDLPFDANGRPRVEMLSSQLDYSDPATVEALSTCAEFLSGGALDLGYDEEYREAVVEQLAAFSRCVRARGVEGFPDPVPGFIGIGSPYPVAEIPYNDPQLPAAAAACDRTVFGDHPGSAG